MCCAKATYWFSLTVLCYYYKKFPILHSLGVNWPQTFTLAYSVTSYKVTEEPRARGKAPIMSYLSDISTLKTVPTEKMNWSGNTYCELSKRRDNMADSTGRSAMTAVVMTALLASIICWPALRLPPEDGFRPRIQTRCWGNQRQYIRLMTQLSI